MLAAAGWAVQDDKAFDPSASTALITATYTPLDKAALRDLIAKDKQQSEQTIAKSFRDPIATSLSIELDHLDYTPFNQEGGLGKAHQLFGDPLPKLLEELNETLAA